MVKVPLITIGITSYNARLTIKRALLSAIKQNWSNKEIVIVNDFSEDDTINIINQISRKYNHIRLINHDKNYGCSQSRNTIINNARGDFIAFFDDDDFSREDRLLIQYNRIIEYEEISKTKLIACYASGKKIYPNGYIKNFNAVAFKNASIMGEIMSDFLLFNKKYSSYNYGNGTPTCSLMARKDVFLEVGLFDKRLSRQEDIDFAIRLGFKGGHFIGVPEKVIFQYSTSRPNKSIEIELENAIYILIKNSEYLKKKKIFSYIINWTKFRYSCFSGKFLKSLKLGLLLFFKYPIRTIKHFSESGVRRMLHEFKMKQPKKL